MNIQNRALLIAAGVGAVIQVVISLISSYLTFSGQSALVFDPATGVPTDMDAIAGAGFAGFVLCCCAIFIDIAIGALYAYLHKQQAPIDMQDGLAGGAASAALARLGSGIVGACASLLLLPTIFSGAELGAGLAGGAISAVVGVCIGLFVGALLGAIGGALGAAVFNRN
jgi:hypothetical protein